MAWYDEEPVRGGYADPRLLALSGIDRMRAGFKRQMVPPPIHYLCGTRPVSVSPASVTFSMPCSEWLQSDAGVYFAGTAALVADNALGGAVLAAVGPGQVIVTSDISFNFLRPVGVQSGQLICRARPIEVGRTLGLAEGLVEDGFGRIVAHCTTRCFVLDFGVPDEDGDIPAVEWPEYDSPDPYRRPLRQGAVNPSVYDEMKFLDVLQDRHDNPRPLSPIGELLGATGFGAEEGRFWATHRANPWMTTPAGTVFGGVLAVIADATLTGAMSTTLDTNEVAAPLDLKVQFVRPVWPDGREIRSEARIVHRGKSFAAAQGEIKNADGKTVVLMTSSAVIRKGGSWGSMVVADEAVPLYTDAIGTQT